MPLIVSPNLTVDRTVRIARLQLGAVLRPDRAVVTAGAKGVNVARVLAALGEPARLVGFVPDEDRELAARLFGREPLELLSVPVPGELRVATIYLEDDGRVTVLNEPGPDVDADDWQRLERTVEAASRDGDERILVCAGSLPPGSPPDGYGRLTRLAHAAGIEVVVDAARRMLAAALPANPDLVTPNLAEAERALGRSRGDHDAELDESGDDVPQRAVTAAEALVEAGARAAVVTAGGSGVALAVGDAGRWIPAVPVKVVNPIGAGDSFVAGYVHARQAGASTLEAVVHGMATAGASCEQQLAGGVEPDRVEALARRIEPRAVTPGRAAGRWT